MKILITQSNDPTLIGMRITKKHLEKISKIATGLEIKIIPESITAIAKNLKDVHIILTDNPSLFRFNNIPSLKWLHVSFAGVDRFIPMLNDLPILLTNSSGVHPIPISEHVLLFMLMFSRQMHILHRKQIEKGEWYKQLSDLPIDELFKKTVGIVGLGRIGQRVARLCKAYNMEVAGLVRHKSEKIDNVDKLFTENEISLFLNKSDFVINCLPLTPQTNKFYTLKFFNQMKKSAYFINIGRGGSVVEKDLIKALKDNIIAGAGLDVFEVEPLPKSSPLWNMKNVLITPHSSGQTPYYMDRVVDIFCENLKAYLAGKPMPNLVDKNKGY